MGIEGRSVHGGSDNQAIDEERQVERIRLGACVPVKGGEVFDGPWKF